MGVIRVEAMVGIQSHNPPTKEYFSIMKKTPKEIEGWVDILAKKRESFPYGGGMTYFGKTPEEVLRVSYLVSGLGFRGYRANSDPLGLSVVW